MHWDAAEATSTPVPAAEPRCAPREPESLNVSTTAGLELRQGASL